MPAWRQSAWRPGATVYIACFSESMSAWRRIPAWRQSACQPGASAHAGLAPERMAAWRHSRSSQLARQVHMCIFSTDSQKSDEIGAHMPIVDQCLYMTQVWCSCLSDRQPHKNTVQVSPTSDRHRRMALCDMWPGCAACNMRHACTPSRAYVVASPASSRRILTIRNSSLACNGNKERTRHVHITCHMGSTSTTRPRHQKHHLALQFRTVWNLQKKSARAYFFTNFGPRIWRPKADPYIANQSERVRFWPPNSGTTVGEKISARACFFLTRAGYAQAQSSTIR
jgi:hypothetical protein